MHELARNISNYDPRAFGAFKHTHEFGPFRLDIEERLLIFGDKPLHLKPKVFELLSVFARNSGHLLSKGELMSLLWPDSYVEEHNLTICVFELRKALAADSSRSYIQTISRTGYRFTAEVRVVEVIAGDIGPGVMPGACSHGAHLLRKLNVDSIAILPFELECGDKANRQLGVGMAQAVATKLSRIKHVKIRLTMPTGGDRLGELPPFAPGPERTTVAAVLSGSIRRCGSRFRVMVQLVSTKESSILWAEMFDTGCANYFEVEDSISEQVFTALKPWLPGEDHALPEKCRSLNKEAYHAYSKGQFFIEKRAPNGLRKAIKYFRRAIRIDPIHAFPYVGLCETYCTLFQYGLIHPRRAIPRAKKYLREALDLDSGNAEAHTMLGFFNTLDWRWAEAEKEFKLALIANPNLPIAYKKYSVLLRHLGRFTESLKLVRRSQELDPLSLDIGVTAGSTLYFARQYDEAIKEVQNVIEMDAAFPSAHFVLGLAYEQLGRFDEAGNEYEKTGRSLSEDNPEVLSSLARIFALVGQVSRARKLIQRLTEQSKLKYIPPYYLALIHVCMGENERAFAYLETSLQLRDYELCLLNVDPRVDALRADTRFVSFLRCLGLQVTQ